MTRWMDRAAEICGNAPDLATDKTDRSGVHINNQSDKQRLSSVLSVLRPSPSTQMTELVSGLSVPERGPLEESRAPISTDWYCRGWGWTEAETQTFLVRQAQFKRLRLPDDQTEALADSLVARDRDGDDRRLCVECAHCRPGPRCSRGLAVLHVLQRCDHFAVDRSLADLGQRLAAVAEPIEFQPDEDPHD